MRYAFVGSVALGWTAAAGMAGTGGGRGAVDRETRPNFLFILVDDLGWTDVGYNGSTFYETPQIDRLADASMVFTHGYAPAPLCSATRASIMTGQYPARVHITGAFTYGSKAMDPNARPVANPKPKQPRSGTPWQKVTVGGQIGYLPLEKHTLAEALKQAGYVTGHVGKWHVGEMPYYPEKQGFDLNFGGYREGWTRSHFYPYHVHNITEGVPGEYMADRLTDEAIGFLERHRDRPFYLQLWHYAVHTPIQAKDAYVAKYEKRADPRAVHRNPAYAGMIQSTDESVGRVLAKLDELGLAERTVVVLSSDNGGLVMLPTTHEHVTSNAPLRGGKAMLWEGGIRVPMLVRWPGVVKPSARCDVPVSLMDLYPTFCALAGARLDPDQPTDGESLVPLLKQTGSLKRQALFWHFPHYIPAFRGYHVTPASAVRVGDDKLIKSFDTGLELYDLADDPGETVNLAARMPDKAAALEKMIDAWLARVGASIPQPNPKYDPSIKKPGELADFDPTGADLVREWAFDRDVDGWQGVNHCTLAVRDGALNVSCTGNDPYLAIPVSAEGGNLVVTIRYRSATRGQGQLFWRTVRGRPYHRSRSVTFRMNHGDAKWHEAAVRFHLDRDLASLRLDPGNGKGLVEIDRIRLHRQ